MTKFDIIVFSLLALSAAIGFFRGAVRETVAVVALVAAAAVAVLGLPTYVPLAHELLRPGWIGAVGGLVIVFGLTYLALRLIGASLAHRMQRTDVLGVLDRTVGLLIGLLRGLVVLGALFLMFDAATPDDLQPRWMTEARTWPLARTMGHSLESLAPRGMDIAGRLKPAFERAVDDASGDRTTTQGYEARSRREIDILVEQSR